MRVIHIPCESIYDPIPTLSDNISELRQYSSLIVVATSQHLRAMAAVVDHLNANGIKARSGGQVLGCDPSAAAGTEDAVLHIGSGRFHPLGIARAEKKPVHILNPLSNVLDLVSADEIEKLEKKRKGAITAALSHDVFGIMVSTKNGQNHLDAALRLKAKMAAHGKRAYIIAGEELSPPNVLPFSVQMLVNTACPRIADDSYHVPVINLADMEAALVLLE